MKMKALFQIFQNFVVKPGILLAEITEVLDLTSNIRGTDTGKCEAFFLCTQIKDLTCGLVGKMNSSVLLDAIPAFARSNESILSG